ncbi:hypothetical protein OROMI_001254 [Orobanche minor]
MIEVLLDKPLPSYAPQRMICAPVPVFRNHKPSTGTWKDGGLWRIHDKQPKCRRSGPYQDAESSQCLTTKSGLSCVCAPGGRKKLSVIPYPLFVVPKRPRIGTSLFVLISKILVDVPPKHLDKSRFLPIYPTSKVEACVLPSIMLLLVLFCTGGSSSCPSLKIIRHNKVYKKLVCPKSKKNTRQNSKKGGCLGICERKSKNVDQYEKKLDDMEGNMRTEQRSISGKASFFVAYVVTSGWTKTFFSEFFQVKRLMLSILKGSLCCDFDDELEVPSNPYHKEIPRILFFSLLGITYFFLAPLILQFVLIYYGLGYIIYRNQLLNGYAPKFETGLIYWGLVLTKQCNFPTLVTHQESMESKVNETKATASSS